MCVNISYEPLDIFNEDKENFIHETIAIFVDCPDEIVKEHISGNLELTYLCPYEVANIDNPEYESFLLQYDFGFIRKDDNTFYVFAIKDIDEINRISDMIG